MGTKKNISTGNVKKILTIMHINTHILCVIERKKMLFFSFKTRKKSYSTTQTHLKSADKNFSHTSQQIGRSMIEMLGVLAIIGVLSIGGIAGFSKAMYNHKLNKQTEQLNHIFAGIAENQDKLKNYTGSSGSVLSVFDALNIIPKEMKYGSSRIRDSMENIWQVGYTREGASQYFALDADLTDHNFDQCKNMVALVKEYHDLIWQIVIRQYPSASGPFVRVYGDKFCSSSTSYCLNKMNIARIQQACDNCRKKESCKIIIIFGGTHWQ